MKNGDFIDINIGHDLDAWACNAELAEKRTSLNHYKKYVSSALLKLRAALAAKK
jgi:hypothetical protein